MFRNLVIVIAVCCFPSFVFSQLSAASVFGDHMVLQRGKYTNIWGYARKSSIVKINFDGTEVKVKTDKKGRWQIAFAPRSAGGPYNMTISSGKEKINFTDVMIGEVWIASGQSNMEFKLEDAAEYKDVLNHTSKADVREFKVQKQLSLTPLNNIKPAKWVKSDSKTVGSFSAVAYFFARKLADSLHVAVGIINSSWGGSQIEGWIGNDAMIKDSVFHQAGARLPMNWELMMKHKDSLLKATCLGSANAAAINKNQAIHADDKMLASWPAGYAPGSWDWQGQTLAFRGHGFMQYTFTLSSVTAKPAVLRLGKTDGTIEIYFNGKMVFQGALPEQGIRVNSENFVKGKNSLLLYLSPQKQPDWYGMGLYGEKNETYLQTGDTTINMANGDWRIMPDFSTAYHYDTLCNLAPSILYNAMLQPLAPYAIEGFLWYQGESNTSRAYQYRHALELMIKNWRTDWGEELPFYYVQLPGYGENGGSNGDNNWAEIRESQTDVSFMPNTAMAVTIDLGDCKNIHPIYKQAVGERLANLALKNIFHYSINTSGPSVRKFIIENGTMKLWLSVNPSTLRSHAENIPGFEIAGEDKQYHKAQASFDGDHIVVQSPDVPLPKVVRYGWRNCPSELNIFGEDGLPMAPFRTDNWPLKTTPVSFSY